MTSNIWNILDMDKECEIRRNTPSVSFSFKHFQETDSSFVTITKLSSNEIRQTSFGGLKWMCKLFEINAQ